MTTGVLKAASHMIDYAAAGSNHKTGTSELHCVLTFVIRVDIREKYHGDVSVEKYFACCLKSEIWSQYTKKFRTM